MQTMELVDIEDVYPYEENDVRMNPRDVDDPACQEYISQLAEQFKYNRLNPGQPRVRPILYRDGGIYQIIDGECRYWAMRSIGTRKFYADVFDDLADAETARQEAAKAMVETDAKRPLTAEEMSRGVQTMLALDLPDEEVAAVARMDAAKVRRARRGAKAVSDASYDMTLDRLAAIAEFEGDEEAVARLRDCTQREWQGVYEALRRDRDRKALVAELAGICEKHGVVERRGEDDGTVLAASIFIENRAKERVREEVEGGGITCYTPGEWWFELRRPETDEDRAKADGARAEAEERTRARERALGMWEREREAQDGWIAAHLGDLGSMRSTAALLTDRAMEHAAPFLQLTGAEVDFSPTAALVAVGWGTSWHPVDEAAVQLATQGHAAAYLSVESRAAGYVELLDAMAHDGYEPNGTGAAVVEALREKEEEDEQ